MAQFFFPWRFGSGGAQVIIHALQGRKPEDMPSIVDPFIVVLVIQDVVMSGIRVACFETNNFVIQWPELNGKIVFFIFNWLLPDKESEGPSDGDTRNHVSVHDELCCDGRVFSLCVELKLEEFKADCESMIFILLPPCYRSSSKPSTFKLKFKRCSTTRIKVPKI